MKCLMCSGVEFYRVIDNALGMEAFSSAAGSTREAAVQ